MTTTKKGWGQPGLAKKAHYFIDGMALCGRWMYSGELDNVDAGTAGPDDCTVCRRKYNQKEVSANG
jgi:hypothetical protein